MREQSGGVGVMHLIDTLDAGGAEGVAVTMANHLIGSAFTPHLCTTRRDGPLSAGIRAEVGRLRLGRTRRLDLGALRRLQAYVRTHDVRILHAHSSSLFTAVLASLRPPHPRVIWHMHAGAMIEQHRPYAYWLLARRVNHVVAVNEPLAVWSRERLGLPAERVHYVPNFVPLDRAGSPPADLPGEPGYRIVCVANLREQKDHLTLIRAMSHVVQAEPRAHLLLVGSLVNVEQVERIRDAIHAHALNDHVSLLGVRQDVAALLRCCDVGVLSSISEGLPLALLEYGAASLPVVATRVGQCEEVLDGGEAGILVEPRVPDSLASALLGLLRLPEQRAELGVRLRRRIEDRYSPEAVMSCIEEIYHDVLGSTPAFA